MKPFVILTFIIASLTRALPETALDGQTEYRPTYAPAFNQPPPEPTPSVSKINDPAYTATMFNLDPTITKLPLKAYNNSCDATSSWQPIAAGPVPFHDEHTGNQIIPNGFNPPPNYDDFTTWFPEYRPYDYRKAQNSVPFVRSFVIDPSVDQKAYPDLPDDRALVFFKNPTWGCNASWDEADYSCMVKRVTAKDFVARSLISSTDTVPLETFYVEVTPTPTVSTGLVVPSNATIVVGTTSYPEPKCVDVVNVTCAVLVFEGDDRWKKYQNNANC